MRAERGALYVRACAIDRTCVRGRERGTFAASVAVAVAVAVAASCVGWLVGWLVGSWFVVVGSYKNEPTSNGSVHRVRSDVIPSNHELTKLVSTALNLPQPHSLSHSQSHSPTVTQSHSHAVPQSLCHSVISHCATHSVSRRRCQSVSLTHSHSLSQAPPSLPPVARSPSSVAVLPLCVGERRETVRE